MQNQFRHYIAVGEGHGELIWLSGALLRLKVSAKETGGAFSLTEVLAPMGCTSPLHTDPNDETLHILEGELRLAIGGEQRTATAGDTLMIRRGVPHAVRVVSESARFLLMNGCHDRFFRLAGEPAVAGEAPPDCAPDGIACRRLRRKPAWRFSDRYHSAICRIYFPWTRQHGIPVRAFPLRWRLQRHETHTRAQ